MGGRGASSGMSTKGRKYGTEYETIRQSGNIKFIRYIDASNAKAPLETMSRGRIYAIIDSDNQMKYITKYSDDGRKYLQIDVIGKPHLVNGKKIIPHVHLGYVHDENGTRELTKREYQLVEKILRIWENMNER